MLGFYDNFPKSVHNICDFSTSASNKRLQTATIEAFFKLNSQTLALEEVATPSIPECKVMFEFGVAEDEGFNYLDIEEKERLLKTIGKKPLSTLDFLCILRYYKVKGEKKTALKSDRYMLRHRFDKELVQIQIFHEKGLMYVSPKDLPEFIAGRINTESSKKLVRPV